MRRPRIAVWQSMIGIALLASLLGVYLYIVRESMRPGIGFVGNNGVHWSRTMTDKEIAETDWSRFATDHPERNSSNPAPASRTKPSTSSPKPLDSTQRPQTISTTGEMPGRP